MKNALDKFISGLNFIFGIVGIIMVFIARMQYWQETS